MMIAISQILFYNKRRVLGKALLTTSRENFVFSLFLYLLYFLKKEVYNEKAFLTMKRRSLIEKD